MLYVACPDCSTKFVITTDQIGKNGRKVKCSKCSHVWHQEPDDKHITKPMMTPRAAETPAVGNGINLPALLPVVRIPIYLLYGMPMLLSGMILFMLITLFPNIMEFNAFLNNKELSIYDLQINNKKETGKIIINYKIRNLSNKLVKLPSVRIRFFDKNNRVIMSKIENYAHITLSPLENQDITTEVELSPPSTIENIDAMIGNKLDFLLR